MKRFFASRGLVLGNEPSNNQQAEQEGKGAMPGKKGHERKGSKKREKTECTLTAAAA